jgi:hypothetical protein
VDVGRASFIHQGHSGRGGCHISHPRVEDVAGKIKVVLHATMSEVVRGGRRHVAVCFLFA